MKRLVLASGSPRRKELLSTLGYDFEVIVSDVEEVVDHSLTVNEIVKSLAKQKAMAVFQENRDAIVIGSDTVVACDGQILGKPHSKQQCKEMMELLRNKSHSVITGVAILYDDQIINFADEAKVYFDDISDEEIEKYIEMKEPYDKAGGYAIQGWAGKFISKIDGNYYSIVGLPVSTVYQHLKNIMK